MKLDDAASLTSRTSRAGDIVSGDSSRRIRTSPGPPKMDILLNSRHQRPNAFVSAALLCLAIMESRIIEQKKTTGINHSLRHCFQ
jgi:hypothetical protein